MLLLPRCLNGLQQIHWIVMYYFMIQQFKAMWPGKTLNFIHQLNNKSNANELLWLWLFSAQQAFETLKLTFGDNKCFLVQMNSQQTPSTNDIIDPWLKYLRRQPKMVILQTQCTALLFFFNNLILLGNYKHPNKDILNSMQVLYIQSLWPSISGEILVMKYPCDTPEMNPILTDREKKWL